MGTAISRAGNRTVKISRCRLRLSRPLRPGEAPAIRGFFGQKFEDEIYRHNHDADGKPIYQYPRVQYKVLERTAYLIGVNEGSALLQKLWLDIDETMLGDESLPVLESRFETVEEEIEYSAEPIEYEFVTPWIALNQKNFREYTGTRNQRLRKQKLNNTLVGNCLGMRKSLGLSRFGPNQQITADCRKLTSIKTSLKHQSMIGFVGKIALNVNLPNDIGLGRSVSDGFGTIERVGK